MMSSAVVPIGKGAKQGRKSRFGCRNCKLRKLKCDETKPSCKRCLVYGVLCNFSFHGPDLHPLSEERSKQEIVCRNGFSPIRATISNAIWVEDVSTHFMLDAKDHELLNKFRYRTLYTLGGSALVDIYESHLLEVCFTCPFLIHGNLAVAAVHDRYLGVTPTQPRSWRESYHWSQCTILLNKWLHQPIKEEHKDPLWSAAGALGVLAFSSMHACSAERAWPLGPPDSSDLEWNRLGNGKMALWDLTNPLRPESVFRSMAKTFVNMRQSLPKRGLKGVPPELARLCKLEESSTPESNPYFMVAHGLSRLLKVPKEETSLGLAMMVSRHMLHEFGACLERKDPVALLLLCLWYTRARGCKWWIDFRARYEIPAICMYLSRYHKDDPVIQELLPWDDC